MLRISAHLLGGRKIKGVPWRVFSFLGIFVPLMRELLQMRYLWQREILLNGSKLQNFLGTHHQTPLRVALRTSLEQVP